MKVLQLIDSLSVGGAERVAVNLANGLAEAGVQSYLCATRQEGDLLQSLRKDVDYLFLNRKGKIGISSISSLIRYCQVNRIDLIHAHSTSLLLGFVVSCFYSVKLVWHNHYGNSVNIDKFDLWVYRILHRKVSYSLFVTADLFQWGVGRLGLTGGNAVYLPNYPDIQCQLSNQDIPLDLVDGKFIVSLANLRKEKDHLTLIKAFGQLSVEFDDWFLVLIGRDFEDDCSTEINDLIKNMGLKNRVIKLGVRRDVLNLLKRCHIGVVSSKWEGLPVSLLEYGFAGLPVVSTSVGEIPEVLGHGAYGTLVPPEDSKSLADGLRLLMSSHFLREESGRSFCRHIEENYSKESVIRQLLVIYKKIMSRDE